MCVSECVIVCECVCVCVCVCERERERERERELPRSTGCYGEQGFSLATVVISKCSFGDDSHPAATTVT